MARSVVVSKRQLVALADLHAHPWAAFAKGDGAQNSRLLRTLEALELSLQHAETLQCPWIFGGDLVHTAGYALNVVLAELYEVFDLFPDVEKFVVWGNHDARGIGGKITLNQTVWAALRKVSNLTVLEPDKKYRAANGLELSGAGAQPRAEFFEFAEPAEVGVYHGTVIGSMGPNGYRFEEGIDPEQLTQRHDVSIVGDIHHPQQIGSILIPGAPEHHNFGDAGERGFWIVTLAEHSDDCASGLGTGCNCAGGPSFEFIRSYSPEFRTVNTPRDVKADGHYYRVRYCPPDEELPANAEAIAPTSTVVATRDLLHGATGDEILQTWLRATPPTVESKNYLQVGRNLLGKQEQRRLLPMYLNKLHLENFCSYEDQWFLPRQGTWLVLGRGRDFPSNGAGKSSLFEAVYWLLFGRTTKGLSGDEVIRWGATECCVTAELIDEPSQTVITVRRTKDSKSSRLEINDGIEWQAASVNEMTDKLSRWLGITPQLFQSLAYFSQEKLILFASATDGERKELLGDLIGLSMYQDAASEAGLLLATAQANAREAQGRVTAVGEALDGEEARLAEVLSRAEQWTNEREQRVSAAKAAVQEFLQTEPEQRRVLMAEARGEVSEELDARRRQLKAQEKRLRVEATQTRRVITAEALAEIREQVYAGRVQLENVIAHTAARTREVAGMKQRYKQAEAAIAAGVCPTCQQPVTKAHREKCLAPLREEIQAGEADLVAAGKQDTAARAVFAKANAQLATYEAVFKVDQELQQVYQGLQQVMAEQKNIETVAAAHVDQLLTEKKKHLVHVAATIKTERNPYDSDITATKNRITVNQQMYAAEKAKLARFKQEAAIYEYWQHGFSKQGIQSLLMDEIASLFNNARGAIFPALTQGIYDVQLSTLSQTKAGDWRERTEFQIFERGKPVPYAALSGGQRRRIDVGVMLVLVKAVAEWMRVPGVLGLLVLDEVFGFLDTSGAEGLMEALREVGQQIPFIYAVSHDQQLQALFPDILMIEQNADGISRIVEGA